MQAARGASLTRDDASHSGASRLGLVLGIALVAWLVDLATKVVAQRELADRGPVDVVGSLLRLNLTRNAGAAFSTGRSLTPVIAVFALVAFVVVLVLATRVGTTGWAWALGLLLAGIAGNLTDRIFREPGPLRGHVIDFLQLPHWPIFNVADMCINVAAALIVLQSARGIPLRGRHADETEAAP
ncbi:signal peptidase II [Nocardioides pocheonensis]|uniref:Lipoprotein signal peptidase n=1 Tax=Nocardioides pocheonensis TaxID=661485 RepID=A0A3N0GU70_9ACTN|nr:signal peptidase II [Nocardioides pocheonensis]RNM15969.1 signal peptidase II [Nocardioides pocheonensis]